jgi:hypothetical protein
VFDFWFLSNDTIKNQISELNSNFSPTGFQFKVAAIDRSLNANWFNLVGPSSSGQTTMKNTLRKGGAGDLNIYTVGFTSGSGESIIVPTYKQNLR